MASKRSQVQSNLQTITANQPVARVIDTFAPAAAPAKATTTKMNIVEDLVGFFETKAKSAEAKRKAELEALEIAEKDLLDKQFLKDPVEFAEKLRLGMFNGLTTVAQLHAGEINGEELGHTYGAALTKAWKESEEFNTGTDEQGFEKFEDAFQANFFKDNSSFFDTPGAVKGFSGTLSSYLPNLRQASIAQANTNQTNEYKAKYNTGVLSATQSVINGNMTAKEFGTKIADLQENTKIAFGFDFKAMNTATVAKLIEVAEAEGRSYKESKDILNLAYSVGTQGSNIGSIVENDLLLRASRAKLQDAEDARLKKVETLAKNKTDETVSSVKSKISQTLGSLKGQDLMELDLDDMFSAEALKEARAEFPELDIFFQKNKDFFVNGAEGGEPLLARDRINMQLELAQASSREDALSLINTWQDGRLKNNIPLFQKLLTQANSINEERAKDIQSFIKDPDFKFFYQRLNGTSSFGMDGVAGMVFGSNPKLNEKQLEQISLFLNEFREIYYGEYQTMGQAGRSSTVSQMYDRYKIKVDKLATSTTPTIISNTSN